LGVGFTKKGELNTGKENMTINGGGSLQPKKGLGNLGRTRFEKYRYLNKKNRGLGEK